MQTSERGGAAARHPARRRQSDLHVRSLTSSWQQYRRNVIFIWITEALFTLELEKISSYNLYKSLYIRIYNKNETPKCINTHNFRTELTSLFCVRCSQDNVCVIKITNKRKRNQSRRQLPDYLKNI